MSRKLFLNLCVGDLPRAKAFFSALGFSFDARFSDEKAACLVLGDGAYAMLLSEPFFRTFTKREPCDNARAIGGIYAVSCEGRAEVDALHAKALAAGGAEAMPPQDHGFLYLKSFLDPDGHHWEVFWMDPSAAPAQGAP